jgi:UPF0755 protein
LIRLLLACAVLLGGLLLAALELQRRWEQPLELSDQGHTFTVEAGETLRSVAMRLHTDGVVPYPQLLRAYGRWTGLDQQVKRGEYRLLPPATIQSLLQLLRSGKVVQYQVTLPEGITLSQALTILAANPVLESVIEGELDPRLQALTAPQALEGMFLPETYQFERGATDLSILSRAADELQTVLASAWADRDSDLPYQTPYDALIMASIIERETGVAAERAEIAGVFVRRLQQRMRLQTDPTVIYGLGKEFDGNLRRADLLDESNVYNTYRHGGLPPTPIALPGRAAIYAAVAPAPGDTLYFVAKGDGSHVFSKTLDEHEEAVRQYQLQRRKDYRSSPGPSAEQASE